MLAGNMQDQTCVCCLQGKQFICFIIPPEPMLLLFIFIFWVVLLFFFSSLPLENTNFLKLFFKASIVCYASLGKLLTSPKFSQGKYVLSVWIKICQISQLQYFQQPSFFHVGYRILSTLLWPCTNKLKQISHHTITEII